MELRKKIFIICVITSVLLFVDGIIFLRQYFLPDPRMLHNSNDISHMEYQPDHTDKPGYKPVNLVVFGMDEEGFRSDVMVLLNFDPASGRLNILSITRDTRVRVRGKIEKINALTAIGGEKLAITGIEQLTGLKVDYYLTLNFIGFRKIIDTLEGIQTYVPFNMDYDDPLQNLHIHLKKGYQLLDGNKAEQFIRYRKGNTNGQGYIDGDIGRIKAQQDFLKDIISQKVKLSYISKVDDVYFILKEYMKTNIEIGDINYYFSSILKVTGDKVKGYTLPGDTAVIGDGWYFICNRKETKKMIDENFFK